MVRSENHEEKQYGLGDAQKSVVSSGNKHVEQLAPTILQRITIVHKQ